MFITRFFKHKRNRYKKKILHKAGIKISNLENIAPNRDVLFENKVKLNSALVLPIDQDDTSFASETPLHIGYRTYFTSGVIAHLANIGRYCSVGDNVVIGCAQHPIDWLSSHPFQYSRYHNQSALLKFSSGKSPVVIGNDVWIGANVTINPGVVIGDGVIIGAGSIVTKNIPPYCIYAGIPATLIRKRFPDSIIERLNQVQWWNYPEHNLLKLTLNDIESCLDHIEKQISRRLWVKGRFEVKQLSTIIGR